MEVDSVRFPLIQLSGFPVEALCVLACRGDPGGTQAGVPAG